MKKLLLITSLCLLSFWGLSQSITTQSFTVGGDFDKFYPIVFSDNSWSHGATDLEISRSSVHTNASWRGSLISKFRFHTTRWGNGSSFIDADIKTYSRVEPYFIADWRDATGLNSSLDVIIWLRGGATTYYYRSSNSNIPAPRIYNGTQLSLPFQEQNGSAHTYRTEVNSNINQNGKTFSHEVYFTGGRESYFAGSLKIGQESDNGDKLKVIGDASVDGTLKAREIKVDAEVWADFVFEENYKLRTLSEVEAFVKENKHLPEIPSAKKMEAHGVNVAEMNKLLLQKIEELTLYLIEMKKQQEVELIKNVQLEEKIKALVDKVQKLENNE